MNVWKVNSLCLIYDKYVSRFCGYETRAISNTVYLSSCYYDDDIETHFKNILHDSH